MAANTDNLDPNTVFVSNINYRTNDEALRTAFAKYGEITSARILQAMYRRQRVSRGIGFVQFADPSSVTSALADTNISLDNRQLRVRQAHKKAERKRDTAFVSGIPVGSTVEQLKAAFNGYNPVDAKIVKENNGTLRGFAFVKFASTEDQTRAVNEHRQLEFNGETSRVLFARQDFDAPPRRRPRRYGRRYRGNNRRRAQRQNPPANQPNNQ